jgi:2-polyprenyl-3-methyl-5-hydroxy-6-metoxy-1,4-benzoquinol methylase
VGPYKRTVGHPLKFCRRCRLLFVDGGLSDDKLYDLYDKSFYDSWGGEEAAKTVSAQKTAYFERHLRRIAAAKPGGSLLDLGCARGDFVRLALSRGYDAFGIEISRYAAQVAARNIGADRIRHGMIEKSGFPPSTFDVVTMFDFLEHVVELESTMSWAAGVTKRDGVLYIVTPDTSSLSFKLMGRHWWHFKDEHLWYFNPRNLSIILERSGFQVLSCGRCRKTLSVQYALSQLKAYPKPFLTPAAEALGSVLPRRARDWLFTLTSGEMQLIARKVRS